jgi:hypothetical protein
VRGKVSLGSGLCLIEVERQLVKHGALHPGRRLHQRRSPLQSGLGRFEQLAEHLRL